MDEQQKASFEAQSQQLRAELKTWETSWAQTHDGKKPGRDDIKRNEDIGMSCTWHPINSPLTDTFTAQKYKSYNKIRDILSGKIPPPSKHDAAPRKRKSEEFKSRTPSKKQRHTETPSKGHISTTTIPLESTPTIARNLFSPVAPRSIGPTPQRDGRVLGLFDLMVERELGTPSREKGKAAAAAANKITATPSKRKPDETDAEQDAKLGRTPMSSSKKRRFSHFTTPLKNKDANPQTAKTPSSVSKLSFDTPAFLKRHSLAPVDENGDFPMAAPLRLPRKPLGRGLSAIVASLRQVEEEEHDDDLDALREIEQGSSNPPAAPKPAPANNTPASKPNESEAPIPDSQAVTSAATVTGLLSAFDDEGMYDSEVEDQLDRHGNPLRVFKKKGQKRTTRRSNMKPAFYSRPNMSIEGETQEEDEVVPETQYKSSGPRDDGVPDDLDDFVPSDEEDSATEQKAKSKGKKPTQKKEAAKAGDAKKEGTVKKTARKVNELAHANFRRLKLKNHGTKGGPGFGSRFRRRR